ncbi:MAG: VCBS repeat-containing protein, partial [Nitrospirales bacterium]|nr:VCBS repeat-containing protein [Nitrospirales bacterium]
MPADYVQIPDWFSAENQGSGIAVADLANNGQKDLVVFMVDAPAGQNRGLFRIGRNLDATGHVTGAWTPWIDIPDWFSWENQGAGIAVADLDHDGKQDLVIFMIDKGLTQNQGYYRVGRMLDVNGDLNGGWGPWIPIPDWFSGDNQYGSIALADLDGDGSFELLVIMVDNPAQQNRGLYRIGRKLDANGDVTGAWTPWIDVPDWFSWDNQGAGIAVLDLENTGRHDLIVFMIDNAIEQNQAFYKIAKNIDLNGDAVGGWSLWRGVPAWFSWENQSGCIAAMVLNEKPAIVVMMVDNPPGQNAGWYRVLPLDNNPQRDGQWQVLPYHSGVLAVHAALCPKGKVLFFAGSGSSAARFGSPDFGNMAKGVFTSVVWNPEAASPNNFFHPSTIVGADGRPFDFFCGGDTFLPDGRLLSAGGTIGYNPFRGRQDATVFDLQTQQWSFIKKMAHGRWYPTLITLGDGRVLAATGLTEDFAEPHNETLEIYSVATNTWELHEFFPEFPGLPLYAHLFLLADGRLLFNGGRMDDELPVDPCLIDITKHPVHTVPVPGGSGGGMRNQSASVIMPPAQDQRVMLIGGGPAQKPNKTDAIDNVDIVDLKDAHPHFVPAAPLNLPRLHLNAVLLPDRTVFVTGGSLKQEDQPLARLQSEIYDPATDAWTLTAACGVPRLYHSTALLLPDGRVVTAGGNPEGGTHVQWDQDPEEEMRLEIFSPPY